MFGPCAVTLWAKRSMYSDSGFTIESPSPAEARSAVSAAAGFAFFSSSRRYFAGRMFWFMRKKLSGSYLALMAASFL